MSEHNESGIVAILLDSGDTLVDEATEVKNELEETQTAELIPGAASMVQNLAIMGYPLGLVADGPVATFDNVLGHYGLLPLFQARAISQEVGVEKPDARMFEAALTALGVAREDYARVVMVGNYLARDIAGANALGLISIWLNWSPRRPKVPVNALEVPDYTASKPEEILELIRRIEQEKPWLRNQGDG